MDRRPGDGTTSSTPTGASTAGPSARSTVGSQDLVSLPVLKALLRERNVTRAGEAVGLTQSATSNALARLRRRFGDDLLVRVGRSYELTPLAHGLLERIDQAFDVLEQVFEDPFEPAKSTREFTLTLSDYSLLVLGGTLISLLQDEAPGVRLRLEHLSNRVSDFEELLRQSDGVILPPDYIRGHPSMRLLHDRWVCVVGNKAPVGQTVTTDDLAQLPWVSPFGTSLHSSAPPVRQLRALGIEPRLEVSVDAFHAVPFLIAGTNRIGFIQERLIHRLPDLTGVRVLPSPLSRNEHLLSLHWHTGETNDVGHRWFRGVLRRAAVDAMEAPPPV